MEPLLFAGENAPEWAFSKRKGVKAPSTADLDQLSFKKENKTLAQPLKKVDFQRLGGTKFARFPFKKREQNFDNFLKKLFSLLR
jgi:hypothetical protein